jgi:suppressor for copper-sensitivity B
MNRSTVPLVAEIVAFAVAAGPGAPLAAVEGPWVDDGQARVRLVSGRARVRAPADPELGLEFVLAPGWHVYWKNPGDAGYPPGLEVARGGAIVAARLSYPAPQRFDLPGGLEAFGYAGEVIYPVDARWAPGVGDAVDGAHRLDATVDYLVCAETCVPHRTRLELLLPAGDALEDPATAPRLAAWRRRLPRPVGGAGEPSVEARLEHEHGPGLTLVFNLRGAAPAATAPDLFFETDPLLEIGRPRPYASAAGPGFRVPLRPVDETRPLPARLSLAWTATGWSSDGVPQAYSGRLDLARPAPGVGRGAELRAAAAFALVTVFVALGVRRSRRRSVTP